MSEQRISEVLEKAADKLSRRGAWIQGPFATDAYGRRVCPTNSNAVRFCGAGALVSACGGWTPLYIDAREIVDQLCEGGLISFSDAPGQKKSRVVTALRQAAALAREQGK